MEYIHLVIPYTEFVKGYKEFEDQLIALSKENDLNVDSYNGKLKSLNAELLKFLDESFNMKQHQNLFHRSYKQSTSNKFTLQRPLTIDDLKTDIKEKIRNISYGLNFVEHSDTIKKANDDLYHNRQRFSIKQKRDFILFKLNKLDINSFHDIEDIYKGNGLKSVRDDEFNYLAKQLDDLGYATTRGSYQGDVKITLEGIEYFQNLNEQAFGLYSFGEELTYTERENLQEAFQELQEELKIELKQQFQNQQEFITNALNALYEVVNESLELIDSKLPKKVIKQAIIGKITEKGAEKGLEEIMGYFWKKLKAKLIQQPEFVDAFENAQKMIESLNN